MPPFNSSTLGSYASKWLIGTGIFEILLASGFIYGGFVAGSSARSGLFLTAIILGAVGIGLVLFGLRSRARAAEAKRVLTVGINGTATITSMTQTGMYLNEQPQVKMELLVQIPGRQPYTAVRKEFVPLILLGRLSSGAPLAVKVDPGDPQDVIIDWENPAPAVMSAPQQGWWTPGATPGVTTVTAPPMVTIGGVQLSGPGAPVIPPTPPPPSGAGMPSAPFAWPTATPPAQTGGQAESLGQVQAALQAAGIPAHQLYSFAGQENYQVDQLRAYVRANGVEGTPTIESLQDTTVEVGDEHLYVIESTVNVPGKPPHKTGPSAAMVPRSKVGHISLGQTVPVRVAADNPDVVMFEWEKIP
jgi:hypothetical protein